MKTSRRLWGLGAGAAVLGAGWQTGVTAANAMNDTSLIESVDAVAAELSPAMEPPPYADASPEPTEVAEPVPAGPNGTYVGAVVSTRWGDMQAAIVVENGRIVDVKPLQVGYGDAESLSINRSAVPKLEQRVLAAQNWNVSYVSGASSTSSGVLASVKDAMRKAGL